MPNANNKSLLISPLTLPRWREISINPRLQPISSFFSLKTAGIRPLQMIRIKTNKKLNPTKMPQEAQIDFQVK